jgi:hypothetical protein
VNSRVVFILGCVVALLAVITGFSGFSRTDGGTISVVRNGGMLDNKQVRTVDGHPQVLPPGSSLTWVGAWSSVHSYSSTQRYFKVSSRPGADSNEVISVPTRDGVAVGVEGTFYFDLNPDPAVLGQFDDRFGTRKFPAPTDDDHERQLYPWDDDPAAWPAFLNGTMGNLVQNDLRREIGKVNCTDLVASCALAQNTAGVDAAKAAAAAAQGQPNVDQITKIQDAVNEQFARDVTADLGGPYLVNIRFVLSKVTLPDNVQNAINDAQAAFAAVTKSSAAKAAADIDAQTNSVRQGGYQACPVCADIDRLRALPPGLTTYAPGAQYAVGGR